MSKSLTDSRLIEAPAGGVAMGKPWGVLGAGWVNRPIAGNAGLVARYTYDRDGLMTGTDRMTMSRDPASGDLLGTTLQRVATTRSSNVHGELDSEVTRYDGQLLYSEQILERDALGRIKRRREIVYGQSKEYGYDYDLAGRLWRVRIDGDLVREYHYDGNGNRREVLSGSSIETCSYDDQDRLEGCGNVTYEHNAVGQRTAKITPGATTYYNYNAIGELESVVLPNDQRISYELDPTGRRIAKRVDGVRSFGLLYQTALAPIAQIDPNNKVVSTFIYASSDHVPDYMVKQGRTYRFVTDHLGSVRMVVEVKTGKVEQRIEYDEFGNVLLDTNPGFQPFGFAGGLYDADTGLVRFGARDYDAVVGRWTSKDPILFGGGTTNLYEYAGGDPVNRIDATGLDTLAVTASGTAGLAVGGTIGGSMIQDTEGFEGSTVTAGFGAVVGVGVGLGLQWTTADSIDDLKGWGGSIGVTVGVVSFEVLYGDGYWGIGVQGGLGAEFHSLAEYTWLRWKRSFLPKPEDRVCRMPL